MLLVAPIHRGPLEPDEPRRDEELATLRAELGAWMEVQGDLGQARGRAAHDRMPGRGSRVERH